MSDGDESAVVQSHERGQRHGSVESCDHANCQSERFNVVEDDLTGKHLVVCEDCGFTMGWFK